MHGLLKFYSLPDKWQQRWREAQTRCGLVTCPAPKPLWQRLWQYRHATLLDGVFYCGPECLEGALMGQLARLEAHTPSPPPPSRIPLGLLMVARGRLTYDQVVAALSAQQSAGSGKIGDWFESLGFATEQEVTSALALQWGCPVAASLDSAIAGVERIPMPILEAFQMLPLRRMQSTNTLCVAFGERVDHAALYAIEKIMECHTQACVAGRKSVAGQLKRMRHEPRPDEVEFGPIRDIPEMARISASYIARLGAHEARVGRVGPFIWLRIKSPESHTSLIFHLCKEPNRPESIVTGCA